jgi:hypothetical protein
MIRLVLIGAVWVVFGYVALVFFRGAGILNEQWDKESERLMTERGKR